jgi:hypothetical protein
MNSIDSVRQDWEKLAKRLNGELYFSEYSKANFPDGIITAKITYIFNGTSIEIHQGIFDEGEGKIGSNYIEIRALLRDNKLTLNIWRLDFLERWFNRKRIKTGLSDFDDLFGIECSNETIAYEIFKNQELRKEFISNKNLLLNTQIGEAESFIRMKCNIAPYNSLEIENFAELFSKLIIQLQRMNLIKSCL